VIKIALLLILSLSAPAQGVDTAGAWLPLHMKWEHAPKSVDPNLTTGVAKVLYFGEHGRFAIVACLINRANGKHVISNGDGQVIFMGEWDGHLPGHVKYRLISRTVEIRGETLPGRLQEATMESNSKGYLLFQGNLYRRVEELGPNVREFLPSGTR